MDRLFEIDAFFAGKPDAWAAFEALRARLCGTWPETALRVMKTCVSFDDPKPYAYASLPRKKGMGGLLLTISLREPMDHPRFFMVAPIGRNRYTVHIHVRDDGEIDEELMALIALSRR